MGSVQSLEATSKVTTNTSVSDNAKLGLAVMSTVALTSGIL